MPVGTLGFIVGFLDLTHVGPRLSGLYGGGRPLVMLVTTANRRAVVASSLDPRRWVGASLAGHVLRH